MPYLYQDIARAVALKTRQLVAGDMAARDAAYASGNIENYLDGTEVTPSMLKHSVLSTAKEIAALVGNSSNALFRAPLMSLSPNLADKAFVPQLDQNGLPFIGSFDGFYDATDGNSLTEQPLQQVIRRIENAGSFWKIPAYDFALDGPILRHTRTNVIARGCVWDVDAQSIAYDTDPTAPTAAYFSDGEIDAGTDQITYTAHGFYTGLKLRFDAVLAAIIPTTSPQIADNDTVYAIYVDADHFKLATSATNALTGVAIDFADSGGGNYTLTPLTTSGGGFCPLPMELEVFHMCKCLAILPEEGWFTEEAGFYRELVAEKQNDIISGKVQLLNLPQMPTNSSSANPAKD